MSTQWDSSWPESAEEGERQHLLEYMNKRFGIREDVFDDYLLFRKNNNYWLLKRSSQVFRARQYRVEDIGIRAFQRVGSFMKPTTRMIQVFGSRAQKGVMEVTSEVLKRLFNGDQIQVSLGMDNGYVILSWEGGILGLGLLIDEKVRSQLPVKEVRYLKI